MIQFTGDDGKDYYKFRRMTIGQERGQMYEHGGKDEVKAKQEHFDTMKEVVMNLEWSFDHTPKQVQDCFQVWFPILSKKTYLYHFVWWPRNIYRLSSLKVSLKISLKVSLKVSLKGT